MAGERPVICFVEKVGVRTRGILSSANLAEFYNKKKVRLCQSANRRRKEWHMLCGKVGFKATIAKHPCH